MKIAFFDAKQYDKESFEIAARDSGIEFKFYDTKLNADTASLARGADGVCIFVSDTVDREVAEKLHALGVKYIALRCAGYNNVDLKATQGKLRVVRVPAYSPYAVAEHAMAMLLTSVRRIHKAYIRTKDFNFSLSGLTGFDLYGKTVGIVGMGKIGSVFSDICRGFGMKILAYDKYPRELEGVEFTELDRLFAESDIISLHCPLTPESYHMISADAIAKMKKGVMIINTSRGALIDSDALLEAIKSRQVGGACLDVYEEEGDLFFEDLSGHIISDDTLARLITMPNVLVTSHQAFLTSEALKNIADVTVSNLLELERDGECLNEL